MERATRQRQDAHPAKTLRGGSARRVDRRYAELRRYVALVLIFASLGAAATALDRWNIVPLTSILQRAANEARQHYVQWRAQWFPRTNVATAPRREVQTPMPTHIVSVPALGPRLMITPPFGFGASLYAALPLSTSGPRTQPAAGETRQPARRTVATRTPDRVIPARSHAPMRRTDMAAFERDVQPAPPLALAQAKNADLWTGSLEAYDTFTAAVLTDPFAAHPRRPQVPEPYDSSTESRADANALADESTAPPALTPPAGERPVDRVVPDSKGPDLVPRIEAPAAKPEAKPDVERPQSPERPDQQHAKPERPALARSERSAVETPRVDARWWSAQRSRVRMSSDRRRSNGRRSNAPTSKG